VAEVERALSTLDGQSAALVRPALDWFRSRGAGARPSVDLVREYLWRDLPTGRLGGSRPEHEVAWALGDLFDRLGLAEQAAFCRASGTHEVIAARRWSGSFPGVPVEFWPPALRSLPRAARTPERAALSLASAHALIETVGEGLALTTAGRLPPSTVRALDDRFRWTEEFPWMRSAEESDIAPLSFLHEHLVAQRLLARDGRRLAPTPEGRACLRDTARLWQRVVGPQPRWSQEFDRDALGVMAASLLRTPDFTLGRVAEEMTQVLTGKWRPVHPATRGSVFDGASLVAQAWYQIGVPLGWWDSGRGPADRRPNGWGRAAAAALFRAVALDRG
jgi:hypothetical protein